MSTIRKRKQTDGTIRYHSQVRKKGFPCLNKSFSTEDEAILWGKEMEDSMTPNIGFMTLNQTISRYKMEGLPKKSKNQQNDEVPHLKYWGENLGEYLLKDITPMEVEICADLLYKKISKHTGLPLTSETRRKFLMTLSFMLNTACIDWKWMNYNPVYAVDKHDYKMKKKSKEDPKYKENVSDIKQPFIDMIRDEMESKGITSIEELSKITKIAGKTARRLLDPNLNSSLDSMKRLAEGLDIKFKIVRD